MLIETFIGMLCLFLRVDEPESFPEPLSREDEKKYFELCKQGDKAAREKLILHNMRLVAHIVKKYFVSCKNEEDLISIGTIGLIKAIDSFDISHGARFATYASRCLQNEILMYFRSQKKTQCEVSINDMIDVDKDGNPLTYMDIISVDDTIAEDIFIKISSSKALKIINTQLDPREKKIIVLRYGLSNKPPLTQREIAKFMNISRSYVSRIEKGALEKINRALGGNIQGQNGIK